jgi:hypothetical protein
MSHFSLLVVTDEYPTLALLEQTLLPYHEYECTGIEKYLEFTPVTEAEIQEDFSEYGEDNETLEAFCDRWYTQQDGKYGTLTNPNKKWDWWVVGGRYANRFYIKGQTTEDNHAQKGLLDLKKMKRLRYCTRVSNWPQIEKDRESGRSLYLSWGVNEDITKEEYLSTNLDFTTFAILYNNQWYENGEMGWFGVVSGDEDWETTFKEVFDSIPDTAWLTVVDCHI